MTEEQNAGGEVREGATRGRDAQQVLERTARPWAAVDEVEGPVAGIVAGTLGRLEDPAEGVVIESAGVDGQDVEYGSGGGDRAAGNEVGQHRFVVAAHAGDGAQGSEAPDGAHRIVAVADQVAEQDRVVPPSSSVVEDAVEGVCVGVDVGEGEEAHRSRGYASAPPDLRQPRTARAGPVGRSQRSVPPGTAGTDRASAVRAAAPHSSAPPVPRRRCPKRTTSRHASNAVACRIVRPPTVAVMNADRSLGSPGEPLDRPTSWPPERPDPPNVAAAQAAWDEARTAARRTRAALDADLVLDPSLTVRKRDDPPRPADTVASWSPSASLAWSPLRSETLLAEARVLEAEIAWTDAWREALLAALTLPVEHDAAQEQLADADGDVAKALADRSSASGGDPARTDPGAEFDLREARLDRADASGDLDDVEREAAALGVPLGRDGADRPALRVPAAPDPTTTRAYRARALRLAADVARSERRWTDGVVPALGLEIGYAGSDARVEASAELRHGRPRLRLDGSLEGTPQERGWARLSAAFRLGSDLAGLRRDVDDARLAEVEVLADLERDWHADVRGSLRAFEGDAARWRLAEDRVDAADEEADRRRAEARARRAWLRMARSYGAVLEAFEAWPAASDQATSDQATSRELGLRELGRVGDDPGEGG